jgi:GAF domain-containing protein
MVPSCGDPEGRGRAFGGLVASPHLMKTPETPANEQARLLKLREYQVLDTPPEPSFDALTALAAHVTGAPIAVVSLVDFDRQWFKSRHGLEQVQTPRSCSLCAHVVASEVALVVPDALLDERFADNPLVTEEPRVRFYAGMPLRTPDGFVLGTLSVMDREPRQLSAAQRELLRMLSHLAVDELEMRRQSLQLRHRQHLLQSELRNTSELASRLQSILASANMSIIETTPDGVIREFNPAAERLLGYSADEVVGKATPALFHDQDEVAARAKALTAELGVLIEPGFGTMVAIPQRGTADERDWTHVRKDGSRVPVHLSVTARRDAAGQIAGYLGIASDLSLHRRHDALSKLEAEVAQIFSRNDTLQAMLQCCAEAIVTHLDAAFARVWTLNAAENVLEMKASAGLYTHLDGPHGRAPVGKFKVGLIAQGRLPTLTNSVADDPEISDREWARREGMVSFAGYPLLLGDRVVGVLAMFARKPLSPSVMEALSVVATNAAVGIGRKEAEARGG